MTFSSTADRSPGAPPPTVPVTRSALELAFARGPDGRTYLARQYAGYPFHVCRPHFLDPELPGMATLYVQSCSGGLFEDDQLSCDVVAGPGAAVHLTSGASTIVHGSRRGGQAEYSTVIRAGERAFAEYLPDPFILFPHARLATRVDATLDPSASLILSDAFIVHDPQGKGEVPASVVSTVRATLVDGTLLVRDRIATSGDSMLPGKPGVMGQWSCHGTLMVITRSLSAEELCRALRAVTETVAGVYAGVSTLPNHAGIWARFLAADAVSLRDAIVGGWKESRRLLTGHSPAPRRK